MQTEMANNIPWQERPANSKEALWRYDQNPIKGRYAIPSSNSIFNSAVVPFKDGYAGVIRCDNKAVQMNISAGFSKNGIDWEIEHNPMTFIEDRYWITWCYGNHGPTIGIGYTFDLKKFYQCENAFLSFNRNGVLFPKKINGKYAMLSRPSDNGYTPFGDIYISYSPDMKYWGEHAALHTEKENKLALFYGAADTVTSIAFGHISETVEFVENNSL